VSDTRHTPHEVLHAIGVCRCSWEPSWESKKPTYHDLERRCENLERKLNEATASLAKAREALEKISKVSQFDQPGGPIVMSEHYEGAWLDCLEIAKAALQEIERD
jgi:hypothetical protein